MFSVRQSQSFSPRSHSDVKILFQPDSSPRFLSCTFNAGVLTLTCCVRAIRVCRANVKTDVQGSAFDMV